MANWREIEADWEGYAAHRLAQELGFDGDRVHVITGNLRDSFDSIEKYVINSAEYATEELQRPGNRRTEPFTPHAAIPLAWDDIKDEMFESLVEEFLPELDIPKITIRAKVKI